MTAKIKIGGTLSTIDLLLQTLTTVNAILVILQIVRDQILLIRIFQIVDLPSFTKETNHQPEIELLRTPKKFSNLPLQTIPRQMKKFSEYCNYFDVGNIEKTNPLDGTTKLGSSC